MTPDARLAVGDAWTEAEFERDTYGPDDREGLLARFESDDASVAVLPVRYERDGTFVEIEGLTESVGMTGPAPDAFGPTTVPRRTAFAVVVSFSAESSADSDVYTLAADPEDALAVACWLTGAAATARELRAASRVHRGRQPGGRSHALSDDERLHATLPDAPERCLFTGKPTNSHAVTLPLRHAAAFGDYPENDAGVPVVPTAIERFDAAVSHAAWTEHDVDAAALDAPVERAGPGDYRLDEGTVATLAAGVAEHLTLVRPGTE